MPRDGAATRQKIMDTAEKLIFDYGFSATSVDKLIDAGGITKGTFFYHFKTKDELALALVERFAENDQKILAENFARAEKLARDPLQQLLVFIGLFEEMMEQLTEPPQGCLFASYMYEAQLFDNKAHKVIEDGFIAWRDKLVPLFKDITAAYPPRVPVDYVSLADMLTVVFEGAFIMSKTFKDPKVMVQQLAHYKNYIELLFSKS
ncbi:MAG: TetR/AcrR family transcriptional regulator [Gammaproteobacteria bacterium]|nr:TetR/AcrR family transcriptional regulator [Gammaproteobacteria bacterium]